MLSLMLITSLGKSITNSEITPNNQKIVLMKVDESNNLLNNNMLDDLMGHFNTSVFNTLKKQSKSVVSLEDSIENCQNINGIIFTSENHASTLVEDSTSYMVKNSKVLGYIFVLTFK